MLKKNLMTNIIRNDFTDNKVIKLNQRRQEDTTQNIK
jgi:hypothetical protein